MTNYNQDNLTLHFGERDVEVYYTIQQACSRPRGILQQQQPLPPLHMDKSFDGTSDPKLRRPEVEPTRTTINLLNTISIYSKSCHFHCLPIETVKMQEDDKNCTKINFEDGKFLDFLSVTYLHKSFILTEVYASSRCIRGPDFGFSITPLVWQNTRLET